MCVVLVAAGGDQCFLVGHVRRRGGGGGGGAGVGDPADCPVLPQAAAVDRVERSAPAAHDEPFGAQLIAPPRGRDENLAVLADPRVGD